MRALSAIGFFISVIGLLLACYNQFGIVPSLHNINNDPDLQVNEFLISMRQNLENRLNMISTLSLVIGVFSVLFCSMIYLRKRTRMTLIGTVLGFITATMAIIHSWF